MSPDQDGPDDELPPLYPLAELPRRPWMPRPAGKPIGLATVYRWTTAGAKGRPPLRTVQIGGRRCTADVWARRFFESLSEPTDTAGRDSRTPSAAARARRRAEAELAAAGI